MRRLLIVVGAIFGGLLLVSIAASLIGAALGGDDAEANTRADELVDGYNNYVRSFSVPIAQTADVCLSTTFGSISQ